MASNMPELAYELPGFVKVYKDGSVDRLMGTETVPPGIDPDTGVESKDIMVTPETGVSARIYVPKTIESNKKLPLVIYFHGGGFYVQTPFSPLYQSFLNSVVAKANIILMSIDYRRAPEYHLPIAYYDSWTAVKWVASHSNGNGNEVWLNNFADFRHVHLGGDSAGANIAHNVAMRAGSEKLDAVNFDGLILFHPFFWGKDPVGEEAVNLEIRARIDRCWLLACPSSSGVDDPRMNPPLDPKLSTLGCRRVLVFGAELDFLRYRARYYTEELGKSGWGGIVEIAESEGEDHVFHLYKPKYEKTMDMIQRIVSFIHQDKAHLL